MTRSYRTVLGLLAASWLALTGCTGIDGDDGTDGTDGTGPQGPQGPAGSGKWLSFGDVGFARTSAEKHQVRTSTRANVNGTEVDIDVQTIIRSNQDPARPDRACDLAASPTTCAGAQIGADGRVLRDDGGAPLISNHNDFSSLLEVGGNKFLVHSYESYPASIYVTRLTQDAGTGVLTATSTRSIDLAAVDGLFRDLRRLDHAVEHAPVGRGGAARRAADRRRSLVAGAAAVQPVRRDPRHGATRGWT